MIIKIAGKMNRFQLYVCKTGVYCGNAVKVVKSEIK